MADPKGAKTCRMEKRLGQRRATTNGTASMTESTEETRNGSVTSAEHVNTVREHCATNGGSTCPNPKHRVTKQGLTWLNWICENCGATGRDTWD